LSDTSHKPRCDDLATRVDVERGRVKRIHSKAGVVEAGEVVIAVGAWSAQVGALAGIGIPIQPVRRQYNVV
jgi:sarcosine oxidase subunit beta